MSIIESQLVTIDIVTIAGDSRSILRLNYQDEIYDLVQVFSRHKSTGSELHEYAAAQLQRLMRLNPVQRYLLVREVGYYSLWSLNRSNPNNQLEIERSKEGENIQIQQASIWLFQELWFQLADLLGAKQLAILADNLVTVTPLLTKLDIDRLLSLDPLNSQNIRSAVDLDWSKFSGELYHLAQKKIGKQFATKLTIEILETMPMDLRSTLENILNI